MATEDEMSVHELPKFCRWCGERHKGEACYKVASLHFNDKGDIIHVEFVVESVIEFDPEGAA
jgi:hypothetical protein